MKKLLIIAGLALIITGCSLYIYVYVAKSFSNTSPVRIYIPKDATNESFRDTLTTRLGDSYGNTVYRLWEIISGNIEKSKGSYIINPSEKAYSVANRIGKGRQTPIKLTINVARTLSDITGSISAKVESSDNDILNGMDSVLSDDYKSRAVYPAAIVPDTYDVYWNDSPVEIIKKLVYYRDKFWNDGRRRKASDLGLSPVEVVTLASIVEEESNKPDEQPVIARLYLNRLANGMKLQADPTVKFALKDFSLRRITGKHLTVNSPYNTYRIDGLPPGPIRLPQKSTIDAVLDAPGHSYLYMCAKEDFSGYHNFATDYQTHLRNARRYTDALNRRGIH